MNDTKQGDDSVSAEAGQLFSRLIDELSQATREPGARLFFPNGIELISLTLKAGSGITAEIKIAGAAGVKGITDDDTVHAGRIASAAARINLELPSLDTDPGVLAHMLVAESRNPGFPGYDEAEVFRGLRAMKAVVVNRLKDPGTFGAPGATTWTDIIVAPGQWHGFSRVGGKVKLSSDVANRITEVMKKANTGAPGAYHRFVSNGVLTVTNAVTDDPFKAVKQIGSIKVTGGCYGFRTAGSADPGGRLIAIPAAMGGVIAGNQFYALKV
jgi:hypothetical protein